MIFDFDGTLVDSLALAVDEMQRLSSIYRFRKFSNAEIDRLKSLSASEIIRDLEIRPWQVPLIIGHLRWRLFFRRQEVEFQPEVIDVLDKIRGQCEMVLVTSSSKSYVKFLLKKRFHYFSKSYCGVAPFGKSSRLAEFKRPDDLYIGDEVRDIKACKSVGLSIAAVTWGYNSADRLLRESPEMLLESPSEILKLLHNTSHH